MSTVQSILKDLLKTPSSTSSASGNTSWFLGSLQSNKPTSYVTVLKAPRTSEASSTSKAVAAKLGVNLANPKADKASHHSLLGSILKGAESVTGNLVGDVIDTAENTPAGLLKLATTNPVDSAKAIGHDYTTRYGKLFKGDFGGFAHDVAQHPFGYLLDASTLGTGGGAVLTRLAPALAEGGSVALRADRAAVEAATADTVGRQLSKNPFTRNVYEKPAYALQRVLPARVPVLGESATATRTILNKLESDVGDLGHHQNVLAKTVRDIRAKTKNDDTMTHAFDQVAADIRHRPLQMFGQGLHTPTAKAFDSKADFKFHETSRHSSEIDQVANTIKSQIQMSADGHIVAKEGADQVTNDFLKVHNARETLNQSLVKTENVVAKINANQIAKSGKMAKAVTKASEKLGTGDHFTAAENSRTLPFTELEKQKYSQNPYSPHQQFPDPKPNPNFVEAGVKYGKGAESIVVKNPVKGRVNNLVKKAVRTTAPKTSSFIDGVRRVDTHTDPIANYLEMHGKGIKAAGNQISKDFIDKYGENPKLAKEISGMFDRHSPANSLTGNFNKATQLWKDIVLVGRPAFLVNNFVGNQIMYHLKQGVAGKALQMAAKGDLSKAFEHHFFEHHQSLGGSEVGELTNSRYSRVKSKVYGTQAGHEQVLRKATMREAAMAIPAIKTEVRALTGKGLKEGDALDQALTKALKGPDGDAYKQMIGKAIDDTLGNYRHYSTFEKGVKQLVPFYGWNRHALRTYTSMIKDQPGRTNVIANLASEGKLENEKNFPGTPDFMGTYVKGKLGTYDTQALNPLKGGSDTIKALREMIDAKSGNLPTIAGNINPLITGAGQALSGTNFTTGAPVNTTGGLLGGVAEQTIGGLPQVKVAGIAFGTSSGGNRKDPHYFLTPTGQLKRKFVDSEGKVKLGPDGLPLESADRHMLQPSLENSVLSWLGVPKRDVNLKTAQVVAKSIQTKYNPDTTFHERKKKPSAKSKVHNIVASVNAKHGG